jgi:hypothetical protein
MVGRGNLRVEAIRRAGLREVLRGHGRPAGGIAAGV